MHSQRLVETSVLPLGSSSTGAGSTSGEGLHTHKHLGQNQNALQPGMEDRLTMAMQLTPKSVTQIASAICPPLSGAADRRR